LRPKISLNDRIRGGAAGRRPFSLQLKGLTDSTNDLHIPRQTGGVQNDPFRTGAEDSRCKPDLGQREAERVVATILDAITDRLAEGGRVELRGFGAFSTRDRNARTGRNPRTGESVDVNAKRVPHFKPGKELRERLNMG